MDLNNRGSSLTLGSRMNPAQVAGMLNLPYIGNIYYVDPTTGNDSTNGGRDQNDAFKTLAAGYAKLTDNSHDVLVLVPGGVGSGTGTIETAAITWSKNLCHLVGNTNGVSEGNRSRITTTTASLSPFITISGSGNSFRNLQLASGGATDLITVRVSGSRNFFSSVHFAQQNATALDSAACYDLQLLGGSENEFAHCTIGNDSTVATAAQSNLNFASASARNKFTDCFFSKMADAAAPFFVSVDASGLDRYVMFKNCIFHNSPIGGGTTLTDAMNIDANPGGIVILDNCSKINTTGWGNAVNHIYAMGASSNSTYNQGIGFAVNPNA